MPITIDNLKKMFTEDEKKSFDIMYAKTILAIDAFDALPQKSKAFFLEDKSAYSRDMNCKINFTMLNVVIRELMSNAADVQALNLLLKDIPKAINELTNSLNVFLASDSNEDRRVIYSNALVYIA
jgi:hypothetical protein